MALITCPECKKEISSYAKSCPHCGFPLNNSNDCLYNVLLTSVGDSGLDVVAALRRNRTLGLKEAMDLTHKLPAIIFSNIQFNKAEQLKQQFESLGATIEIKECDETDHSKFFEIPYDNAPVECPRCHSGAVTTGSRGFSILTGFIGSGKTVNRCAKCGYTWKP